MLKLRQHLRERLHLSKSRLWNKVCTNLKEESQKAPWEMNFQIYKLQMRKVKMSEATQKSKEIWLWGHPSINTIISSQKSIREKQRDYWIQYKSNQVRAKWKYLIKMKTSHRLQYVLIELSRLKRKTKSKWYNLMNRHVLPSTPSKKWNFLKLFKKRWIVMKDLLK